MAGRRTRRDFVKGSLAAAAGASLAMSLEEQVLLAQQPREATKDAAANLTGPVKPGSKNTLPTGKLGKLHVSRIILGGNLIGGWAHARDLLYVSELLKAYHTDEKVLETLQIAEEHGINCINTHPDAGKLIQRYRKERGGKMLWLVQSFVDESGDLTGIKRSIDQGADSAYIQGNVGDQLVRAGRVDLLGKAVEFIRSQGLATGVGGHRLDVPIAVETAKLPVDYHVKTLHSHDYWSAKGPDGKPRDNCWCDDPKGTIEYMAGITKPWIAFKVMAAGAIPPEKAFTHIFNNGADFAMVGMFDFQIDKDARIARKVLAKVKRKRPWQA